MNKWFYSATCKGLLLILAHLCIVVSVVSFVWVGTSAGLRYLIPFEKVQSHYESTAQFENRMKTMSREVLDQLDTKAKFETNGSYNPDKLIDVVRYDNGSLDQDGTNHSGIAYRLKEESIVEKGVEVDMPTKYGHFRLIPFRQKSNGLEHIALIKGTFSADEPVLVRVHSSCATGDIFSSRRCDCGEQLHKALRMIEAAGKGALVYLNQEGRGIGLMEKMKAYKLQENGMDTVDANICLGHKADERDYGVGAQILREIGIHKMRLITNNPVKRVGLEAYGLEITEIVPVEITPNPYNERYLHTKKDRMGHTLHFAK